MDAKVRWAGGLQFVGDSDSGHGVLVDSTPDVGGFDQAARPVELLLVALCSCTGMDVVSILHKMRLSFERFEVGAHGTRREEHPKTFERIELVYRLWGEKIDTDKLTKAIDLSLERYCPVANTLKGVAEIAYRYELNPEDGNGGNA